MTHPIIKDLLWRRTTKQYDSTKKVSESDLKILFEAMQLSASSINSQPWKFIVIESNEAKQRLHQTFAENYQFNQKHAFDSSQVILFAHKTHYSREDYAKVVDQGIKDKRTKPENRESAFGGFLFAEMTMDENGNNSAWTKAQTYLALGNTLHTLARLRVDATPLEGIDSKRIKEAFKNELDGYQCDVALAIGYKLADKDFNANLPKSRLALEETLIRI